MSALNRVSSLGQEGRRALRQVKTASQLWLPVHPAKERLQLPGTNRSRQSIPKTLPETQRSSPTVQPTLPAPTSLGGPLLPVQLPLECIQPALHVAPGTPTRARQGDVEEARGWGRASGQLLVLAPPTVTPKAENIGHPREGTWSRKGGVRSRKKDKLQLSPHPLLPPPRPYLTGGYRCHCFSPRPLSKALHLGGLRGAWDWRRAPGAGGWSCDLGPHPHCSLGWRGR